MLIEYRYIVREYKPNMRYYAIFDKKDCVWYYPDIYSGSKKYLKPIVSLLNEVYNYTKENVILLELVYAL